MTDAMALAKAKNMLAEVVWTAWLGFVLGCGFAFGWWLVGTL